MNTRGLSFTTSYEQTGGSSKAEEGFFCFVKIQHKWRKDCARKGETMDFFQLMEKGKKECLKDSPAPCSFACPLGIDVREFIRKFQRGLTAEAYKEFSLKAVLPGTVCHICKEPCKNSCVRKEIDEAVSLKEIEYFCWKQMRENPKKSYYIREKNERILICGGEAGQLAAAVKLARRGYPVDIAVKGEKLGGTLWDMDKEILPETVLEEDLQEILSEKYICILQHTAEISPETMMEYDAVLLGDETCCAAQDLPKDDRVFKMDQKEDVLENIEQGILLSYQIEEYVKIHKVFMTKKTERKSPYIPEITGIEKKERIQPKDATNWTYEEIQEEAGRCLACQCSRCFDVCPMMQHYNEDYKQLASAVLDTVEAQEIDRKRGLYPLMSCLQCGACEQACPVNIDTRSLCLSSRRLIHKKKILPEAHYHFWLNDMEHADKTAEFMIPSEETCEYVYFPGCQMGASYPGYVEKSYEWLWKCYGKKVALWNRCCGAPADWCGNEALHGQKTEIIYSQWRNLGKPVFILSCPTCMEQFEEHFSEIKTVTLWSLLAKNLEKKQKNGRELAIFDSCAARDKGKLQEDIRRIVSAAGYDIIELDRNKENAQCCGYGGLVYSTNPQMVQNLIEKNSIQDDHPYVTYCTNCMDSFRLNGKDASFIFDLLFEMEPQRSVPDPTQRRKNRMHLKHMMQKQYLNAEEREDPMPYEYIHLQIDVDTKRSMMKQLLLEEDLKAVIGAAEETGIYLYDADTEERIAHRQSGFITVWVRYKKTIESETYQICSVYFHRIKLKGEQSDGE